MYKLEEKQDELYNISNKNKLLFKDIMNQLVKVTNISDEMSKKFEQISMLLLIDPGIAAQKMFNIGVNDLRTKIKVWGLSEVSKIATQNNLPEINTPEKLYSYKVRDLIKLVGAVGIVNSADKSRLDIAYDLRNVIEHEDHHFEATKEDVQYIFSVIINGVLSVEVIEPITVTEIQELIDSADKLTKFDDDLMKKYESSATFRQVQVLNRIMHVSLDKDKPDLVRTNAYNLLKQFRNYVNTDTRMEVVEAFITGPNVNLKFDIPTAKVFHAIGITPYVSNIQRRKLYEKIIYEMKQIGPEWNKYEFHSKLFNTLKEIGYFKYCPKKLFPEIMNWMIELYIGSPGGYGYYGINREVFYSDIGVRYVKEIVEESKDMFRPFIENLELSNNVKKKIKNPAINDRYISFFDLFK